MKGQKGLLANLRMDSFLQTDFISFQLPLPHTLKLLQDLYDFKIRNLTYQQYLIWTCTVELELELGLVGFGFEEHRKKKYPKHLFSDFFKIQLAKSENNYKMTKNYYCMPVSYSAIHWSIVLGIIEKLLKFSI